MIQRLVDGISKALSEDYPEAKIYTNTIEQGMQTPCFLITLLKPESKRFMNNRYWRTHFFDVHYFPSDDTGSKNEEMYDMAEHLTQTLEIIHDLEGVSYESADMSATIRDEVLHFFIHYNFYADREVLSEISMEEFQSHSNVQGGKND